MVHIVAEAVNAIRERAPGVHPRIGIILGSGLGAIGEALDDAISMPYANIPGFPVVNVLGHKSQLLLGKIQGVSVACLQGRAHGYEGHSTDVVKHYVRTLKALGCEQLIVTNAAGGMHEHLPPGSLVLLKDHINLQPTNPLVGANDDEFGPRFFGMEQAYHPDLRAQLQQCAESLQIELHEGVYVGVSGPNYETAAEIKAFQTLGGDVVGMSTVAEVLVAAHCQMQVLGISVVSNYATGIHQGVHDHHEVVATAHQATQRLVKLLLTYIEKNA